MKFFVSKPLILLLLVGFLFGLPVVSHGQAATPADAVQEIKILEAKISNLEHQREKIQELINYYNNVSFLGAMGGSAFESPILKDLIKEAGASDDGTTEDIYGTWAGWFFGNGKETKINSLKDDYAIKGTDIDIAKRKIELLQMQVNGASPAELEEKLNSNKASNRADLQQRLEEVKASGVKIKKRLETCSFTNLNVTTCVSQFFASTTGLFAWFSQMILRLANNGFNLAIWISISEFYSFASLDAVGAAWSIVRDICNLFFIFVLLYIAISTILNTNGADVKKLLAKVIIVALLVNFSAVVPKVVIDISNIFALQFYGAMGGGNNNTATGAPDITTKMVAGFNLGNYGDPTSEKGIQNVGATYGQIILKNLGQMILMLVTAFVLVAGAFMFLFRTVILLFLIITSPLFFLGMAVPYLSKHTSSWLNTLISQSLFAPVMMFLMLITITFAVGGDQSLKTQIGTSTGVSPLIGTVFYFAIVIGMMFGSLVAASKISSSSGTAANKFRSAGTAFLAGGALAGAGFAGRNIIGRGASRLAEKEWLKNAATQTGLTGLAARATLGASRRTAKGSFDLRNIKVAQTIADKADLNLGKMGKEAGKGGYQAKLDKQVKAEETFVQDFSEEQKKAYAESLENRGRFGAPVKWFGTPRKRQKAAEKIGDLKERRKVEAENAAIEERNRAAESSNQSLDLTVQQARNNAGYVAAKRQLEQEEQKLKQAEDGLRVALASGNQATIDNMKKAVETRRLMVEAAEKDFNKLEKPIKDLEATRKKPEEKKVYKRKEKPLKDQLKEVLKEEDDEKKKSSAGTPPPAPKTP